MKIEERVFGHLNGEKVVEYTVSNDSGMSVSCLNYGCVITKIMVPDQQGHVENVVLGFDNLDDYQKWSPYFGAVVGRVAGRIQGASFELEGKAYQLADNESPNHLHGGRTGFHAVLWDVEKIEEEEAVGLRFSYLSADGEEGYPGNLAATVTYLLTKQNELAVTFGGKTDQTTLVNLTNHSYFNLSGNLKRDCTDHLLQMECDSFLELASDLIPTGELLDVAETPFDFREGRRIADGIASVHPQNLLAGNGYDHPFVFTSQGENQIVLRDEESGRSLEVTTDQPSVVVYTSNMLAGPFSISGVQARNYLGVCLETQGFPDAIHHSEFPSIILEPGEAYYAKTTYRFITHSGE